ncbi:MAG: alpha/beta hydrolase [Anaerolineales bacterium]
MRGETKELNDSARRSADGSFITLTDGVTHYELGGNKSGEVVVLIHGFSVPYFIYDPTFEFLTRSGFSVLRYDLFGRGFSERPDTRYNVDLFVRQLSELLDALQLSHPVNLIGLSMGGLIAATFTARHPDGVKSLTLIDPAGARSLAESPMLRMIKLPFIAEAILSVVGGEPFIESNAKDFFDPKMIENFKARYRIQMQYKGFLRAILSSVRNGMLKSYLDVYKQIGKMNKPILLFWGKEDVTVPLEHGQDLLAAMPKTEFHIIEGCGHTPHYEKPDVVNPILLKFLLR